jgi:hypothetical protein
LLAITFFVFAAAGCTHPMKDDGTPNTGLYLLTETRTGSCTPTSVPTDRIQAAVIASGAGKLRLSMGDVVHVPVQLGDSFEVIDVIGGTVTFELTRCNAALHREITIERTDSDRVDARKLDRWSNLAAADRSCGIALPADDCAEVTTLDYELSEPCPRECIKGSSHPDPVTGAPAWSCSC